MTTNKGYFRNKKRILFILKEKNYYGSNSAPYGLLNSCKMVAESLKDYGVESKIVLVKDSNQIDKEVFHYKPTHVILEAIWCPPTKLQELLNIKRYKHIKWSVRLHSKIPFIAQERLAFQWLTDYNKISQEHKHFKISCNNEKFLEEINVSLGFNLVLTPNSYIIDDSIKPNTNPIKDIINIGCFGALRTLKNQLQQAICAIYLANKLNKKLKFHINDSSTYEREGASILNNLIHIFKNTPHELIIHKWNNHHNFIHLVKKMDIGMQISFSETFNITAADFVSAGIPVIGSKEIDFLSHQYQAETTNFEDIVNKLEFAIKYKTHGFHIINEILLRNQVKCAIKVWLEYLK